MTSKVKKSWVDKEYAHQPVKKKWTSVCWVSFLDGSMGSQLFQVKPNLLHRHLSWRHLSVPDTAFQHRHLCHSTSDEHTFTLLCANLSLLISVRKHVHKYQLFQWIHQSLDILQINDIGNIHRYHRE